MKRIFILVLSFCAFIGFSQELSTSKTIDLIPNFQKSIKSSAAASVGNPDTIFHEQFAGGLNGWTNQVVLGPGGFIWSNSSPTGQYTTEPLIFSSSSFNGAAQLNADGYNTPGSASTFKDITAYLISPPINTLGHPELYLEFQHYFRPFTNAQLTVGFSGDGVNFNEIQLRDGVPTNSSSANPVSKKFNVSQYIGNLPTAYIRFAWKNESHYFWQIDDVILTTPPANDLRVEDHFFNNTNDITQKEEYYTRIPLKQANSEEVYFGALASNVGILPQSNTRIEANISGPQTTSNVSSTGITINPGSSNVPLNFAQPFRFLDGEGSYFGTVSVTSDSTDFTPGDNSFNFNVIVTDTVYARDDNMLSSITERSPGTILTNTFEIFRTDTVTTLSTYVYHTTANPSIGSVLKMYLLDENYKLIAQSADKTILNLGWQNFRVGPIQVQPGKYHVGVESISGNYWIGVDTDRQPPYGTTWICAGSTPGSGGQGGTWLPNDFPNIPFIRMHVKDYNCDPFVTNINVASTSTCNGTDGSIGLSHLKGVAPFNYQWTALNPENSITNGQGTDSAYGLNPGFYRVRITDNTGCSEVFNVNVSNGGAPNFDSYSSESETCYGSNDGNLEVVMKGGSAPISYTWSNGETGVGKSRIENLRAGKYTVTVTDGGALGCNVVDSFQVGGPLAPINASVLATSESCDSCNNGILTFSIFGGTPPYSYAFTGPQNIPDGIVNNAGEPVNILNLAPGFYNMFVEDNNQCTYQNSYEVKMYNPLLVNEFLNNNGFLVYPNPVADILRITTSNKLDKAITWELFDVTGKKIKSFQQFRPNLELDVNELPSGNYFLQTIYKGELIKSRFFKQN